MLFLSQPAISQSVTPPLQPRVGNLSHQEECCHEMHVQTSCHCNAHFDLERTVVYVGGRGILDQVDTLPGIPVQMSMDNDL
jgi:hypothetical protein